VGCSKTFRKIRLAYNNGIGFKPIKLTTSLLVWVEIGIVNPPWISVMVPEEVPSQCKLAPGKELQ
jgi:hypothetical protein